MKSSSKESELGILSLNMGALRVLITYNEVPEEVGGDVRYLVYQRRKEGLSGKEEIP